METAVPPRWPTAWSEQALGVRADGNGGSHRPHWTLGAIPRAPHVLIHSVSPGRKYCHYPHRANLGRANGGTEM